MTDNAPPKQLPEWPRALELVVASHEVVARVPEREQQRIGSCLRTHLRGVLRRLARARCGRRDVDLCAEFERAEAHCAHLDYLWTLVAELEWLPRIDAEAQQAQWLALRQRLHIVRERLASDMTLRRGWSRARRSVGPRVTRSLADATNTQALAAHDTIEQDPSLAAAASEVCERSAMTPVSERRPRPAGSARGDGRSRSDSWVQELGSWLEESAIEAVVAQAPGGPAGARRGFREAETRRARV